MQKWTFLKTAFDKILLFTMFAALIHLIVWMVLKSHMEPTVVNFLEQSATTILGAFIGLTQAHRVPFNSQNGTNGSNGSNGSQSSTPKEPQ